MATYEVQRSRVDLIRGISQDEVTLPLGYFADTGVNGLSGVEGASGSRRCHVPVIQFKLPELSALGGGGVIQSVTIHYEITAQRHHQGIDFDAHVYLLDTADPSGTGTDFYFHGATDSDPNVMFVGETELERVGTDAVLLDPPISASHALPVDALLWFQDLYTGAEPSQSNVYFRFNKTLPSISDLTGSAFDRFFITTDAEDLFIEITTVKPPPFLATGGSSKNAFWDAEEEQWWAEHVFTESGTFEPSIPLDVHYLIVGGGGGGGDLRGGGGGGGAVITNVNVYSASATEHIITVGDGGGPGQDGEASEAFGVIAGGGGAGQSGNTPGNPGVNGSSGGGAGFDNDVHSDGEGQSGGAGDPPGHDGGDGNKSGHFQGQGGGGGGAGGHGVDAANDQGGNGGIGVEVWGRPLAGGGGGGTRSGSAGTAVDGGGDGGFGENESGTEGGEDGTANTGGGGGGAGGGGPGTPPTAGAGGSGIVIVRYEI